jgi:NADH-quinone oxidoreductase subunit N
MGKFYVFGAALQHQYFWLVGIAMINAAIAAVYYLNVVRAMFFVTPDEGAENKPMPVSIPVQVSLVICVIATLWLGVYPSNVIGWVDSASRQLLALML